MESDSYGFGAKYLDALADAQEAESVALLAELAKATEEDGGTVLSFVFMRHDGSGGYDVRLRDDTVVLHLDRDELAGRPVADVVRSRLDALVCAGCGDRLIPGEAGVCGPCEATATMDLLRIRSDLDG